MTKRTIIKNLRKLSIRYKCSYEYYLDRENGVYNATIKGDDNQRIKDYLLKRGFNYSMLGASFMDYDLGICVRVRGD